MVTVEGSNLKRFTHDIFVDQCPLWSPDGEKIAFRSKRYGVTDIIVMDPDGSNPENVSRTPQGWASFYFCPEFLVYWAGNVIAFAAIVSIFLKIRHDHLDERIGLGMITGGVCGIIASVFESFSLGGIVWIVFGIPGVLIFHFGRTTIRGKEDFGISIMVGGSILSLFILFGVACYEIYSGTFSFGDNFLQFILESLLRFAVLFVWIFLFSYCLGLFYVNRIMKKEKE